MNAETQTEDPCLVCVVQVDVASAEKVLCRCKDGYEPEEREDFVKDDSPEWSQSPEHVEPVSQAKPPSVLKQKKSNKKSRKPPIPVSIDEDETEGLKAENEKLIAQLNEFTDEMETRLEGLMKKDKLNQSTVSTKSNKDIQDKMNKLSTKA